MEKEKENIIKDLNSQAHNISSKTAKLTINRFVIFEDETFDKFIFANNIYRNCI